ncbi:TldD/PmbA family protein [Leptolyngbya cf. ectocarpi LEGE 11479]|uniref:TldD/PmbA family protein n=1 Tax=Leptolyngbya cf. ectocarpi LEGE 11479 TaxID=1828722 RepID=A0A929A0Q2_LEPEC|nr:TldD/PmbA family protein [Leptolyngbya ectocarpi]MBE9070917.1 TldD/PmbA family protein [Leptolyngbya cf. ectocarpi LEGE 11479]
MFKFLADVVTATTVSADWIGIRAVKDVTKACAIRDAHPERNAQHYGHGAMVEVLAQGQFGYSATNDLSAASLATAIVAAYEQAMAASAWAVHRFTTATRPKATGNYISPQRKGLEALSPAELNQILLQVCDRLKVSDQIAQTSASARSHDIETWFVSSNGSEIYQRDYLIETHIGTIAQDGPITQLRTDHGYLAQSYQGGWELFPGLDLWQRVQQVGEQAVELLHADNCPDLATTLVLAPDQMMLQIHESIGHPLELDRILGDERNYAGGSFIKLEDFGSLTYGSELMNVTFDPTVVGELGSYGFDDVGTPATREYLIRAGKLERGLGGLESQQRSNVPGVANSRASSWNRPAIDRMANINLEPGERSFEQIIANIEQGIYMETNRSWSIDDQRHKFQFGCEYGKLIENGKLTRTLKNPNYRSVTPQFWHSLSQVGDGSTWDMYGTPFCGKGEPNQLIRVGYGAPVCAFNAIEVFGGAV